MDLYIAEKFPSKLHFKHFCTLYINFFFKYKNHNFRKNEL